MNKKDNIRNGIGSILILIMVAMGVAAYVNQDTWFKSVTKITYADGCVEVFHNDALQTDECTEGRALEEQRKQEEQDFNDYKIEQIGKINQQEWMLPIFNKTNST